MSTINSVIVYATMSTHIGWTPQTLLEEIHNGLTTAISQSCHMEWEVEFPCNWLPVLEMEYYPFSTYRPMTVRQRLLECPEIKKVTLVSKQHNSIILKPYGEVR
jgi:hypothetical protein